VLKLGLTGGIATGKSAVAAMLRELGFAVLDADAMGHQLMEPGESAYQEILEEFGASLAPDGGRINRNELARLVFRDRAKLEKLNAILHPRIKKAMLRKFGEWQRAGDREVIFVEAALLVEAGFDKELDGLVITNCRPEQQFARLTARGLTETEAKRRIAAQLEPQEKLRHATYLIDCSGSQQETSRQVAELAAELRRKAARP
jgi:dephospho-CoA kinase